MLAIGYSVLRMGENTKNQSIFSFLFASVCMSIIISIIYLLILFDSKEKYKVYAEYCNKLLLMQQQHYQSLILYDERLKRFRHDYKNHIRCLRMLADKREIGQIKEYLIKIDNTVESCECKYNVGNDLVNCILSEIDKKYEKEEICLIVRGYFPESINIDNVDLCIIISNLIVNAFEATQKVFSKKQRTIYFNIKSKQSLLYIEIVNPILEQIYIKEGMIETTKANKEEHGFGIQNVKECINRYNGNLVYTCSTKEMKAKIMLII
jgi:sensor histidine kinase regulating citrate/malate metabolism